MSREKILFNKKMQQLNRQVSNFNLVGQLLKSIVSKKAQIYYLQITVSQQEYWIKIPKKTWESIDFQMNAGTWLSIRGKSKLCSKTGSVKLKASVVQRLNSVVDSSVDRKFTFSQNIKHKNSPRSFLQSSLLTYSNGKTKLPKKLEVGLEEHLRIRGNFNYL